MALGCTSCVSTVIPRQPGQYFDAESGLHYNYFRDYDPKTGRDIEPDPIGLAGGNNPYLYVNANPLNYADSLGLNPALGAELGAEGGFIIGGPLGGVAGAVIGGIGGYLIADQIKNWMESRSRGKSYPIGGRKPFNPGKDSDGKCKPCPPPEIWTGPGNAHGSTGGIHYHAIVWNQDPCTCMCYPKRVSVPSPDNMR